MIKVPLWSKISIGVVTCLLVGFLSGISTQEVVDGWYAGLTKPSFNPPNWVFAPVWTVLYVLMGVSAGIVWNQGWNRKEVNNALMIFLSQLIMNSLWSTIFFGTQSPVPALVIIILLWLLLVWTIKKFLTIKAVAAYLLIPYLLWVSFAVVLNASIVYLN